MRAALLTLLIATTFGDLARDVRRAYRPTREPATVHGPRARALKASGPLDADDLKALVDAYVQLEKELAPREATHLEFLQRGRREKTREQRPHVDSLRGLQQSILEHLGRVTEPALARELCDQALGGGRLPLSLRLALARQGSALREGELGGLVKRAGRARSDADRLTTLTLAAALGRNGAGLEEFALECIEEESGLVRAAAVDALVALASPSSLAPLVERLELETGRQRTRIAGALQVLTGARIHASAAAWRTWLEKEGGPYLAGERTLGHGEPVQANTAGGGSYYGLPLVGDGILFVLDTSKSMSSPVRKPKEGEAPGESRMERAKGELIQALGALPSTSHFGILSFGGTLGRFSEGLVPATERNVAEAQRWVQEHGMDLGTRLHDALQLAFADAGRSSGDEAFEPQVETIFVLTDGRPIAAGKADSNEAIRAAARRFNLRGHVVLHTIGLGGEVPKRFLRDLAKDHGGRFVHER